MNLILCGVYREAISVIFQDTTSRLKVLQNVCPQYFCDNGSVINGMESKDFVLPKIDISKPENPPADKVVTVKTRYLDEEVKQCSKMSSDDSKVVSYGPCGRFERRMCHILDSIELAKAGITGTQAIQLPNGRIQYIDSKHIRERKFKEDLQIVSKCLSDLIKEVSERGTFQYLVNYVNSKKKAESDMSDFVALEKESVRNIDFIKFELNEAKKILQIKKIEYLTLIQHLKHQKQENFQKNIMQYQFSIKHNSGIINECKDDLGFIEDNLSNDFKHMEDLILEEENVNIELMMYLRNNVQTLEQSVTYWVEVYNIETQNFQKLLRNLDKDFIQLKNNVATLQQTYHDYEIVCIEGRAQAAKAAKIAEVEAFFHSKAFIIQSWWRYMCCSLTIGPYAPKRKKKKKK